MIDTWNKTWPIGIPKRTQRTLPITPTSYEAFYKDHIMSLDILTDASDNSIISTFRSNEITLDLINEVENQEKSADKNQNFSLDSLLESLPLVYNPSTKQLQIVKLKTRTKCDSSLDSTTNNNLKSKLKAKYKVLPTNNENWFMKEKYGETIEPNNESPRNIPIYVNIGSDGQPKIITINVSEDSPLLHFNDPDVTKKYEEKFKPSISKLLNSSLSDPVLGISSENGGKFSSSSEKCEVTSSIISSHLPLDGKVSSSHAAKKKRGILDFFGRSLFPWKSDGKNVSKSSGKDKEVLHEPVEEASPGKTFSSKGEINYEFLEQKSVMQELPAAGSAGLIMEERPGNLPAKTPFEQERHKQEYKDIVCAAKKKEMKEAKGRQKAHTLQLKQEKQLSESVNVWKNSIIPNWSGMRNQKKCQDLWWSGIPSCVRGKVWSLAIGNELNITKEMYWKFVQRSLDMLSNLNGKKRHERSVASDCVPAAFKNQESTLELIRLDVSRTFPHLCIFQEGGPYHDTLHNILGAYVCFRPDVGYVQGMSFLAATLLLNMDESDAFVYFANLVQRPPHIAFFSVDQRVMQAYYVAFERALSEHLPFVSVHLRDLNVTPSMYFLDWVLTVFARSFPLDIAARMWDVYLRDGEEFFIRAAIGILKHFEKELLAEDCTAATAQFLTRLPEDLNADALFKDVLSVPPCLSAKTLKQVLAETSQETNVESV